MSPWSRHWLPRQASESARRCGCNLSQQLPDRTRSSSSNALDEVILFLLRFGTNREGIQNTCAECVADSF